MLGHELQQLICENEIQFIWAVFSAVPRGFRQDITEAPYVDGNTAYWSGVEIHPQLEGALFEIACWDSGATILVGLSDAATTSFIRTFPDAKDLLVATVGRSA